MVLFALGILRVTSAALHGLDTTCILSVTRVIVSSLSLIWQHGPFSVSHTHGASCHRAHSIASVGMHFPPSLTS